MKPEARDIPEVVVIGGGPAGATVGGLLASWGHSVRILARSDDPSRGLGESLPPSTHKLLSAVGVLDAVERAGFYRSTGNTVWWASNDRRVEPFDPSRGATGFQVHRPAFDRVLLDCAERAGARVTRGVIVRRVRFGESASIVFEDERRRLRTISCRFVLDCSGRAGVVARRYRRAEPGPKTYALVGVWQKARGAADGIDPTHTVVETYEDGWAWSVPISATTRHAGAMIDGTSPRVTAGRRIADAYRAEVAKAGHLHALLDGWSIERTWACDASLYSATVYGGPQFLLVGDAASFIDPLSSFGVKKALASAWIGAVVVHTCRTHPERTAVAIAFFSDWERETYATQLQRSRDFASEAFARHRHPFWAARAGDAAERSSLNGRPGGGPAANRDPAMQRALEGLRERSSIAFRLADGIRLEKRPVIRGREIVLEESFEGMKFAANVDLVTLAKLACDHRDVPALVDAYCRSQGPVPLPNVLAGLSLLVAKGILRQRV
jgi:flavin-dependent dehydrogenase